MDPDKKEVAYQRSLSSSEYKAESVIRTLQYKGALPPTLWNAMIATKITHEKDSYMRRTFIYEWNERVGTQGCDRLLIEVDLRCLILGRLDRMKQNPEEVYDSTEEGAMYPHQRYAQQWRVVQIRMKFEEPLPGDGAPVFPKRLGLEL